MQNLLSEVFFFFLNFVSATDFQLSNFSQRSVLCGTIVFAVLVFGPSKQISFISFLGKPNYFCSQTLKHITSHMPFKSSFACNVFAGLLREIGKVSSEVFADEIVMQVNIDSDIITIPFIWGRGGGRGLSLGQVQAKLCNL